MPVATLITDLSATLASNSPSGGEAVGTNMDNYMRSFAGFIRQLYDSGNVWCGNGSGADTIVLTPSVPMVAHKTGQTLAWVQASANTGAVTVNPSSLGAKAVTKRGTTALTAGDLPANAVVLATYDGTQYQLIGVQSTAFSDSVFRIQDNADATKQLAFEVSGITTGTTRTITVPDASTTLVGTDTLQTLTNKTMTGNVIVLSQGSNPAPTTEGDIQWDTDDDVIVVGTGSGQKRFFPVVENTYVPTVRGSSVAGTATYSVQSGDYQIIGGRCHFSFRIVITNLVGATGGLEVSMPFAANAAHYGSIAVWYNNLTTPANSFVLGVISPGSSLIDLYSTLVSGAGTSATLAIDTAFEIIGSGSFRL